jgi:4-nitrophenyl phosphatase
VIRHIVMDMDGVLYRGDHPLPGAVDTLTTLRARGVRVAFLTNNASRHREELAARMSRLGFACATDDVWGSAYITALYLSRHAPDARVFLVGTAGMRREMEEAGVEVMPTHEGATHVVAGLDMTITYEKLSHAHYAICNGAAFIATNLDATFPDGPTTTTPEADGAVADRRVMGRVGRRHGGGRRSAGYGYRGGECLRVPVGAGADGGVNADGG